MEPSGCIEKLFSKDCVVVLVGLSEIRCRKDLLVSSCAWFSTSKLGQKVLDRVSQHGVLHCLKMPFISGLRSVIPEDV